MKTLLAELALLLLVLALAGCPPTVGGKTDAGTTTDAGDGISETDTVTADCTGEKPACKDKGVCADKAGKLAVCTDKEWVCDYAGVIGDKYEEEETTCDGLDNDCDSDTDEEDAVEIAETLCDKVGKGVCKDGIGSVNLVCNADEKKWECDYSGVPYFADEEHFTVPAAEDTEHAPGWMCDGLDNDCDGDTDEELDYLGDVSQEEFDAAQWGGCDFLGVCEIKDVDGTLTGQYLFHCAEGQGKCNAQWIKDDKGNLLYEDHDGPETRCDGLDNNCNGETDEMTDIALSPCLYLGVCQGKTVAACTNGAWVCNYDALLGSEKFQSNNPALCKLNEAGPPEDCGEKLCDGLDNDCDGVTDDGLQWVQPGTADCLKDEDPKDDQFDCKDPACALYVTECDGTPIAWNDCPLVESKIPEGGSKKMNVALEDDQHRPLLEGVCAYDPATGESPMKVSCEKVDDEVYLWKCNGDETPGYTPQEKYLAGGEKSWCDALDNDCDGLTDDQGEIIVTDKGELTPCRFLGECEDNFQATCNPDGQSPGKWTCKYNLGTQKTVQSPPATCPPDLNSLECLWDESKCDGLDNDCDGWTDEMLAGREIETACEGIVNVGVCTTNLSTTCQTLAEGTKGYVCDMGAVPGYKEKEEGDPLLCDGLDNDCDAQTDEEISTTDPSLHFSLPTGCLHQGVCQGFSNALCNKGGTNPGKWSCDYSQVPLYGPPKYTNTILGKEVACDGKDNDCDGKVDEELNQADFGPGAGEANPKIQSACALAGPCEFKMKWSCQSIDGTPTWVCDPSALGDVYEQTEMSCDLVDNDCDGEVDEALADPGPPPGANCKTLGVCAVGVKADCVAGEYLCHYDDVPYFDGLEELQCDGLDNDCDGLTDAEEPDFDWKKSNGCIIEGVCGAPDLKATCLGAKGWSCLYTELTDYEKDKETKCDQKDNDCDGTTDESTCKTCDPCTVDNDCMLMACRTLPDAAGKRCATKDGCVSLDPATGICISTNNGGKACGSATLPYFCTQGTWVALNPGCFGNTPLCVGGECKACQPGAKKCDGATKVVQCAADGITWAPFAVCPPGKICMGKGECLSNDEKQITPVNIVKGTTTDISPKVAARSSGGFVVVYQSETVSGASVFDIAGRLFKSDFTAEGGEFTVNTYATSTQTNPDVASIPEAAGGGFIAVWESQNQQLNAKADIYGQLFKNNGNKFGNEFLVNVTFADDQKKPSVAVFSDGSFVVTWESMNAGVDTKPPGVFARLFDKNGNFVILPGSIDGEILVNTFVENSQNAAAVFSRGSDGFGITWTTQSQFSGSTQDVAFRLFNPSMIAEGPEDAANIILDSSQKNSAGAGFPGTALAGQFVLAWEAYKQEAGGNESLGVFMQYFDATGAKTFPADQQVNNYGILGTQRDPEVAIVAPGAVVVTWEAENLLPDADTYGVGARAFDAGGNPYTGDEFLVNQSTAGAQQNPDVADLGDGMYVIVWEQLKDGAALIFGRLFKVM